MYKAKTIFKVPESRPPTVLCNKTINNASEVSVDSHKQMLDLDDTVFLNVSLESADSPINETDINLSSFDSPDVNLNTALIIPHSLKRKSSEGIAPTCKKRLLDDVSFDETFVSDTELLQIQSGQIQPIESRPCSFERYSQLYFSSQFEQVENVTDEDVRNETQIDQSCSTVTKLNLTQMFNDDFENDIQDMDVPCNQTQMFLDTVKAIGQVPKDPTQKLEELDGTMYKSKNGNIYIQLQRSMEAKNETNVIDDDYVDAELSQAIKSSQYLREIEDDFAKCEKTICNIGNLNESDRSILNENSPSADIDVALNKSDEALHGLSNMSAINWNSPMVRASQDTPKSSFIKTRLAMSSKNRQNVQTTPKSIVTTKFSPMGSYYGLPTTVKSLIKDYKGIDELYDWQNECLTLPAVSLRRNLIYALPTSGGKTLVAEILILREVICRRTNCLFILPYVSIVQEKIWALSPFAVQLEFLLEEYAAGKGQLPPRKRRQKKSVYIATIEKGLALLDSLIEVGRANEIGLIVVDELHIIGEPGRGATLETLLTKAMFINAGIQIVGMSATIGNLSEIGKFLNADIYTRNFRPVELKEYVKCGSDILSVNPNAPSPEEAFTTERTVDYGYSEDVLRRDPDHLGGLVNEIIPDDSVLVFCSSKKNCENVALLLCRVLPRKSVNHRQEERNELKAALQGENGAMCPILAQTIPYGIAYHHSGLTTDERRNLESAFRQNIICVICCTSTLAAGVNLPAKRVIIRSPYIGRDFLTLSRYKQMVGRAGRAGMGDCGESITIFEPKDYSRLIHLLTAPMDEAASGLHLSACKGLTGLILSSIGLGIAVCQKDLHQLISRTLLAVQAERLGLDIEEMTNQIIRDLFKLKALTATSATSQLKPLTESNATAQLSSSSVEFQNSGVFVDDEPALNTTKVMQKLVLKPSTKLTISRMGKASFKSCIDLQKSKIIYNDLMEAQKSLVLTDHLHLLYIVTPYEPADINVTIDMTVYYNQYSKLTPVQLQTAKALGINESCAVRMVTGQSFKSHMTRPVHRFFLTLILHELWQQKPIHQVADMFHVNRGVVQNLATAAASYSSSVIRFCEELEEFWACKVLLGAMVKQLSYCCTVELLPLMDLPCVRIGRARQLYSNGFRSLEDVAKSTVGELVDKIEHLNYKVAKQLISAAKVFILERLETLRGEVHDCLEVLTQKPS
ncbi:helicase POLQ-like [Bradysia coprophila]|uniref:helicase POLQ-like n=1 Tax=Bradysia coprophila TaxID=38358 RepID=UPI00187D7313|nr:helicase POLQ-like [Bradysia coprophila]